MQVEAFVSTDEMGHIPGAVGGAVDQFVGPRKATITGAVANGVKEAFVPVAQGAGVGTELGAGVAIKAPKTKVQRGESRRLGVRAVYTTQGPLALALRSSVSVSHGFSKYSLPNGIVIRNGRTKIPQAIQLQFEARNVELEQTLTGAFGGKGPVRAEIGAGGGVAFARTRTKINSPILKVEHVGSQKLPYAVVRIDVMGGTDVRLQGELRQYKTVGLSLTLGVASRF
jgi:hypothetical protein